MASYQFTLIGIGLATVVLLFGLMGGVDFFEQFVDALEGVEAFEIDEFIFPAVIVILAVMLDMLAHVRRQRIEMEKIRIYQAMLHSTHHILNNFLNQVLLFKITAEKTPGFDTEVLELYDQTIAEATAQIQALSSLDEIDEESIHASVLPGPLPGIYKSDAKKRDSRPISGGRE